MTDYNFEDLAAELLKPVEEKEAKHRQAAYKKLPTGTEPGIVWDGSSGELRTGPLKESPGTWDGLLEEWGLDPQVVEVVEDLVRVSKWQAQTPDGIEILTSYKAQLRRRQDGLDSDISEIIKEFSKHKPAKKKVSEGQLAYVHVTSDTQIGKDDPRELIEKFFSSVDASVDRLKQLRKQGFDLGSVYLLWPGDCLSAETEIVTRQHGIVPIGEVVGQFVDVRDANGEWVKVQIKSYGLKPITEVVWKSRRAVKTVRVSNGHEWILSNGERVRTEDLKPGMAVSKGYRRHGNFPALSQAGVQAGFIYGDGTATGNGCRALFGGDKDQALVSWFPGVQISERDGKDQRRTAERFPQSWKSTPSLSEGTSYLLGWLAGYFAADGCVDDHGGAKIASADRSSLEFVRSVCAVLGIDTYPIREVSAKSVGRFNGGELYEISLSPRSLPDEFFLLTHHRDRILAIRSTIKLNSTWVVESVNSTGVIEETFCTEVPTTSSFLLADGLLTSNCIEGVKGHYSSQLFTVKLNQVEMVRLFRRMLTYQVKAFAPFASRVVTVVVPGNHDEASRNSNGKSTTNGSDSWATEGASILSDILKENPETYGHVSVVVPQGDSLAVSLDVCGTPVGVVHGHQFPSGTDGWKRWWADQAHGCQDVGNTTLLVAGHKHHLKIVREGAKTFIQAPSLDSGSQWWVDRTGQHSKASTITFTAGQGSWDNFREL